ncbi:DUF6232 family protein [Micromonospora sp. NPDC049679]|uniref:DUF6232 family protein n=1 Tax=Micromonospora sp. NPDC049679 TaxID=3155920 RepID=UPI0033E0966D
MHATRDNPRLPGTQSVTPDVVAPRIPVPLYRQPGIYITPEWFIVAGRRFPVRELSNLQTVRGSQDRLTGRAVGATAVVLGAMGTALGFRGINHLTAATYLALAAAAFVPGVMAWFGHRVRPRSYELWGQYRGLTTLLYSSDEERQYGQVTRALVRAQEASRLGSLADPVASTPIWVPKRR